MQSTAQNGEKAGYKVILLLVVGLAAFSSAMKELNQLQQFTLDGSRLMVQLAQTFGPREVPQAPQKIEVPQTPEIEHLVMAPGSCNSQQSKPSVELPWLSEVADVAKIKRRPVVPRPSQVIDFKGEAPFLTEAQIANLKKLSESSIDSLHFEFRIPGENENKIIVISDLPNTQVKSRARKQREIRNSPREHEMFLKTLNRSFNVRFAS